MKNRKVPEGNTESRTHKFLFIANENAKKKENYLNDAIC